MSEPLLKAITSLLLAIPPVIASVTALIAALRARSSTQRDTSELAHQAAVAYNMPKGGQQ